MKHNFRIPAALLALLLLVALAAGCTQPPVESDPTAAPAAEPTAAPTAEPTQEPTPEPTPEPDVNYTAGTRTDTSYESTWLGLSYTLPSDMVMATDDEINTLMNIGADMLIEDEATGQQMIDYSKVTVVYEMMAVSIDGTRNVQVLAEVPMLANMTAEQYIALLEAQLPALVSGTELLGSSSMELCGKTYQTLDYAVDIGDGIPVYGRYLVIKQGDRMGSIVLSSTDAASLDTMLEDFAPLA